MDIRHNIHPAHAASMNTGELRTNFLIEDIFLEDQITMTYSHIDRIIVGGIFPKNSTLVLEPSLGKELGVTYFLERREMGVINIGGDGEVFVDGVKYELKNREALYIPAKSEIVKFSSIDGEQPAKFYFNSTPAHQKLVAKKITKAEAKPVTLGDQKNSNARTIFKYIVPDVVETCQLMMGLTSLEEGNMWNSMPCHTHERRMEVYFYFDLDEQNCVFHLMGEKQETRHVVLRNENAILSPSWSLHSGVGTKSYSFIWGMAGENQVFEDMDHIKISELK